MNFTREFSYSDISQRRMVLINAFFTFILAGFILTDCILRLKHLFPYAPAGNNIIMLFFSGLLAGTLLGHLVFSRFRSSRVTYITVEILFVLFSLLYLVTKYIPTGETYLLLAAVLKYPFITYYLVPIPGIILGIKSIYFLKITSGDYIDEKLPILPFIALFLTGSITGIVGNALIISYYSWYPVLFITIPVLLVTSYYIKLPYNPVPMHTSEPGKEQELSHEEHINTRDDVFFTYLNFSYIVIYSILLYFTYIKYYGFFPLAIILLIVSIGIALLLGLGISRFIRNAFWHVYSEMLYPLLFIAVFIILSQYHAGLNMSYGAIIAAIPSIMFGFSLANNITHITGKNDHPTRFSILHFSLFIIPIPIFIAMFFYVFNYRWFFILFYVIALLNVLFPGIFLFQHKKGAIKKILYFIFSLVFIPLLIVLHINFNIPLSNDLFIPHSKGYNTLTSINYNAEFITRTSKVKLRDVLACEINNITVRNLKRSLFPMKLYGISEESYILFIDGYQKFFKNPVPGVKAEKLYCCDYVPTREIDYQQLAVSGRDQYISHQKYLMEVLSFNGIRYDMIVDMPNLYDQQVNRFRFSSQYIGVARDRLTEKGIFMQIYDVTTCDEDFFNMATKNVKQEFTHTISFLFGNFLVLAGTNRSDGFMIKDEHVNAMRSFFENQDELSHLFLDTEHFLSHMLQADKQDLSSGYVRNPGNGYSMLRQPSSSSHQNHYLELLNSGNDRFMDLVKPENVTFGTRNSMRINFSMNDRIYSLLKLSETAELNENYEEETELLFQLRRIANYRYDLRQYIERILAFKEHHYQQIARNYEKEKQWEKAVHLYNAILTINPDNFQANYRLGTLNITLQNMDIAYKYLTHAMRLEKQNPRVPYQIGVLLLSQGKSAEALEYLTRARELEFKSASLFLYIGLCHESLGNLQESKRYYEMALKQDPNDGTINSSLERINRKIENEKSQGYTPMIRKNQNEDELGESIPLPINKSAFEIRLSDDEASETDH